MLLCPTCKSSDLEYAGYEALEDLNGNIEDVIEMTKCNNCKDVFPGYEMIDEEN